MNAQPELESVCDILEQTNHVIVLTGAGISAESGIPTFRGKEGLWKKYKAEQLATPTAFIKDPKLVWEWYDWRRGIIASKDPNAGHMVLVGWEELFPNFVLITQNIDGLHQRAGSKNVIELHGNIHRVKCFDEGRVIRGWPEDMHTLPRCYHCGGLVRPDVVWFGEILPAETLEAAISKSLAADVFLSIGTSAVVHPAASLPLYAKQRGAILVEINPYDTPLTREVHYALRGPAGEILPAIVQQTWLDNDK